MKSFAQYIIEKTNGDEKKPLSNDERNKRHAKRVERERDERASRRRFSNPNAGRELSFDDDALFRFMLDYADLFTKAFDVVIRDNAKIDFESYDINDANACVERCERAKNAIETRTFDDVLSHDNAFVIVALNYLHDAFPREFERRVVDAGFESTRETFMTSVRGFLDASNKAHKHKK